MTEAERIKEKYYLRMWKDPEVLSYAISYASKARAADPLVDALLTVIERRLKTAELSEYERAVLDAEGGEATDRVRKYLKMVRLLVIAVEAGKALRNAGGTMASPERWAFDKAVLELQQGGG